MQTGNYVIWILGSLFIFVTGVAGLIVRIGLTMFQWRREIDAAIAGTKAKIAGMEVVTERNEEEIKRLRARVDALQSCQNFIQGSK